MFTFKSSETNKYQQVFLYENYSDVAYIFSQTEIWTYFTFSFVFFWTMAVHVSLETAHW